MSDREASYGDFNRTSHEAIKQAPRLRGIAWKLGPKTDKRADMRRLRELDKKIRGLEREISGCLARRANRARAEAERLAKEADAAKLVASTAEKTIAQAKEELQNLQNECNQLNAKVLKAMQPSLRRAPTTCTLAEGKDESGDESGGDSDPEQPELQHTPTTGDTSVVVEDEDDQPVEGDNDDVADADE